MSTFCLVDQAPATEGNLCTSCSAEFRTLVRQVPSMLHELDVTLTKQSKQTSGERGGGSSSPGLVFNVAASDVGDQVWRAVRAVLWCSDAELVSGSADFGWPLVDRVLGHWPSVCRSSEVAGLFEQLQVAMRAAGRVIDRAPEREVVGTCDCGGLLVVSGVREEVRCPRCLVLWEVADLREIRDARVAAQFDRFLSVPEVCALFRLMGERLPAGTVRSWISRGVVPLWFGPAGYNGVLGADVLAAARGRGGRRLAG